MASLFSNYLEQIVSPRKVEPRNVVCYKNVFELSCEEWTVDWGVSRGTGQGRPFGGNDQRKRTCVWVMMSDFSGTENK